MNTSNQSTCKVVPLSASIKIMSNNLIVKGHASNTVESSDNEIENKNNQVDYRYFMGRTYFTNLNHCVKTNPPAPNVRMNVFSDHDLLIKKSQLLRLLIIIKVLISVAYFVAWPIALIIILPEIIGYYGIRIFKEKVVMFYGIWLFSELVLRVIFVVIMGLDWVYLNTMKIALFSISSILIPYTITNIALNIKFYNVITTLDDTSKEIILGKASTVRCPP